MLLYKRAPTHITVVTTSTSSLLSVCRNVCVELTAVCVYTQSDPSNGHVVYFYAEARTKHTTLPDGTEMFDFPSGQVPVPSHSLPINPPRFIRYL